MASRVDTTAPWGGMDPKCGAAGELEAGRQAKPEVRRIPDNGTLALRPRGRRLSLRGQRGTLLVTQEGDPLDHVLEPGDELCTAGRGLVVVWALSEGAISVSPVLS